MRAVALVVSLALSAFPVQAAVAAKTKAKPKHVVKSQPVSSTPCSTTETAPLINVPLGKSTVLKLKVPASRIIMGNPGGRAARPTLVQGGDKSAKTDETYAAASSSGVADVDVVLLNPNEIYLLGKSVGSTNIIILSRTGVCTVMDIAVGVDTKTLESRFNQYLPGSAIKVTAAADSIMLSGTVADATQVDRAVSIASAYTGKGGDSAKVINMLSVADPQQVMLEVKVAEVSKTLVDQLGAQFKIASSGSSWTYSILSNFLSGNPGVLSAVRGNKLISLDAQKKNGLIKILAEPTIMAISGQEGSFLAGGRILIPVSQSSGVGVTTITLEEKEFGVALKFTPTVLASGRINLKVRPEVSELSPNGIGISVSGSGLPPSILPLINTRKAETTVQLNDGQSFAIGGLIQNNVTQNINAFPVLGEIPILGALFRSSDFESNRSELMIVVTPHLVKPLPMEYTLPTDNFIEPSRSQFFLGGKMEGTPPPAAQTPPAPSSSTPPAASGFELK